MISNRNFTYFYSLVMEHVCNKNKTPAQIKLLHKLVNITTSNVKL